jgi:hypothetical protein
MLPRSQMLETWRASETIVLSFRFRCGKLEVLRQIFIFDSALRKERLLAELSVILGSVTLSGIHRIAFGLVDAPGSANSFGIHRTNGLAPSLGLPHGIHHQKVWIGMSCGGHSPNRFIGLVDAPGSANSFGTHRTNGLAPSLGMSHGHSPPESQVCLVAFTFRKSGYVSWAFTSRKSGMPRGIHLQKSAFRMFWEKKIWKNSLLGHNLDRLDNESEIMSKSPNRAPTGQHSIQQPNDPMTAR